MAVYSVQSGNVKLHALTLGDPTHPALVLVHGYPDNHRVWLPVAQRLQQDFYVILYDVRGAGESDIPKQVKDYDMALLSQDLQAVVDAIIPGRGFHLAAHDWGSIQSWESVTTEPLKSRILSYTTISGPCLDHMGYWMRQRFSAPALSEKLKAVKQSFSSWYIWFFQTPVLPTLLWKTAGKQFWGFVSEKVEKIPETLPNPYQINDGAYGVRLYRANFRKKLLKPEPRYAACPVQLLVPTGDNYVNVSLFSELHEWVPELFRQDIAATHWVLLKDPDAIAKRIGNFASAVERGAHSEEFAELRVG